MISQTAQEFLTDENIDYVAKEIVNIIKNSQDDSDLKRMQNNFKKLEKKKNNILQAIYKCEVESIRKTFYDDLTIVENNLKQLSFSITKEESKYINITVSEIKFFLKKLRKGSIANFHYKKTLINTLINKVLLYEDKMSIIFNINNVEQEITISLIESLESSSFKISALLNVNSLQIRSKKYTIKHGIIRDSPCFNFILGKTKLAQIFELENNCLIDKVVRKGAQCEYSVCEMRKGEEVDHDIELSDEDIWGKFCIPNVIKKLKYPQKRIYKS